MNGNSNAQLRTIARVQRGSGCSFWIAVPIILWFIPDFFGLLSDQQIDKGLIYNTAILWLATGIGAVLFRTVHLFYLMGFQSGLVWAIKILTDPFHDIKIYHRAPLHILHGDMYDDMTDWYRETAIADERLTSQ